jgi:hypothetical protein
MSGRVDRDNDMALRGMATATGQTGLLLTSQEKPGIIIYG